MKSNPLKLKLLLSYPNNTIAVLRQQINRQVATLEVIKTALPKELADHALHCVYNNQKILIFTDSAAWASQIHFYGKAILNAIVSATQLPVTTLKVKVIHLQATSTANTKSKALIPSQSVIDEIQNHSLAVTDKQLKESLTKLSLTLRRLQCKSS